jgi:hypothetical protein
MSGRVAPVETAGASGGGILGKMKRGVNGR